MVRRMLGLLAAVVVASVDGGVPAEDNLVTLARVWEQVRLFHPYLYERDVDWDQAWITFAPRAEAATSPEALQAVIGELLATLKDPVTRIRPVTPRGEAKPGPLFELKGNIPVVNAWSEAMGGGLMSPEMAKLREAVKDQPRVVFDLRGTADLWTTVDQLRVPGLGPSKDVLSPARRVVVHHGYSTAAAGYTGYSTVFEETLPNTIRKASPTPRRYAFVIDPNDVLPDLALAMQRAGEAFIVSTAPTDDRVAVSSIDVELGEGKKATIRTSSLAPPRGLSIDLVVPNGKSPIDAAIALVNGKQAVKPAPSLTASPAKNVTDRPWAEAAYPSRELRQLAGVRVWMIARRFWAYSHLTTENYDALLGSFLPRLANAKDEIEYALTVAEMTTHLPDGHTFLRSPTLRKRLGTVSPQIELRVIEKQFVAWSISPEGLAAGVKRGDVVLEIDDAPVATREAFLAKYTTASHPEALRARLAWLLLSGDEGTKAKVKFQLADGSTKVVELERKREVPPVETSPVFQVLDGNLGYIDLVRLTGSEVEKAMSAVANTRALIFDMRGYPKGTAFTIGPMLDVRHPRGVAQFFEPRAIADASSTNGAQYFLQTLEPAKSVLYTKPTVMLIDERAVSQSEHSGLIFEAYAGTTFIGSPTAGANGDITQAALPGGLMLTFSGHDVRHADGRQLQNIGLVPDVLVRPTIAAVRAGRDEVLEAAKAWLTKKLSTSVATKP